ncbi:MAG TPA: AAA family ATPase [Pyrinomonadaceae bacterium]|jgi:predicted transcriptional regulator
MTTERPAGTAGKENTAPASASVSLIHASGLKELPRPEWLIDKKLPRRGLGVIYGQPGSGKTFYQLDQLLTVAQTQPVVYAPTEGLYGLDNRLAALCDYRGLELGKFYVFKKPVELMKLGSVNAFIQEVRGVDPVLIAFDTLSGCMVGGDENAPKDMGLFVHGCQTVIRQLDCFVSVAHHMTRKGNNERGHSSLRGAAEIMIAIECKGHAVTATCTKSKDSEPFPVERFTLTPHMDSMVLKSFNGLNKDQTAILRAVAANPGIKPKALIEQTEVSQASVYRILREFKTKEFVEGANGGCYYITDKGEKAGLSQATDSENAFEVCV